MDSVLPNVCNHSPPEFREFLMSIKEQEVIGEMFDRIAMTYDKINQILSFGQDSLWRKRLVSALPTTPSLSILDVATGTADVLIAMCRLRANIDQAIGVDISDNMLSVGRKKIAQSNLLDKATLIKASACNLPFTAESFDVVSIAFGIRNIIDVRTALREFARVLKQGGSLLILEFSMPNNRLVRHLYLSYFRNLLPLVGGWLSKDYEAYRYLNTSVESFLSPQSLKEMILSSGFNHVALSSISFGIATIYCARKV